MTEDRIGEILKGKISFVLLVTFALLFSLVPVYSATAKSVRDERAVNCRTVGESEPSILVVRVPIMESSF